SPSPPAPSTSVTPRTSPAPGSPSRRTRGRRSCRTRPRAERAATPRWGPRGRVGAVSCCGSEVDALGAEGLDRVDGGAVVRGGADLEVEVGSAGVAGVAGQGDLLAGLDDLADLDVHLGEVGVLGVGLVAVLDDDGVAVGGAVAGAVGAGLDDGAA